MLGQTNLTFDANGRPAAGTIENTKLTINATWSNGSTPSAITTDLSSFSQFAGATLVTNFSQNGQGLAEIMGYEITSQGVVSARLTNGQTARIGSLSVASVTNQDGLVRSGTSTYSATDKAGAVTSGLAGTGSRSKLLSRSLEYSNVDLAGQFVELVMLQRAYSANSKVISTASEVIKDTISLIR